MTAADRLRRAADFREALELLRQSVRELLSGHRKRRLHTAETLREERTLREAEELAFLLTLTPDPRDAAELLSLLMGESRSGYVSPDVSERLRPLGERVLETCPKERAGLSAEGESVRLRSLELLFTAEQESERLPFFEKNAFRKYGPQFRELLAFLPSSAAPHADAARLYELGRRLGPVSRRFWEIEDTAAELASVTAPEPPHAPRVHTVPAFLCLLEPDPPLVWEGRAEVSGIWLGGGYWRPESAAPSDAAPLSGSAWRVTGEPLETEAPELLPVRFPLPLRRRDLPSWRGWVPAPGEAASAPRVKF